MASIDRFQIVKEPELKVIEHWFEDEDTRRRMDGMLPLDVWYERVNQDEDNTVIMAYDGQLPAGMVVMEFVEERAYIGLIVNPLCRFQGYGKQILKKLLVTLILMVCGNGLHALKKTIESVWLAFKQPDLLWKTRNLMKMALSL